MVVNCWVAPMATVAVAGVTRFYAVARDTTTFVGLTHGSLAVDLP